MKKQYLKYIFVFILCLMFFLPNRVSASYTSDYTIDSYNIDMVVNEDNTFDITEIIKVYFNVSKHGIYRKIPLKNTVTRTDGTSSTNKAKITNLSVSETYTTSNESGYKVIKIGDSNKTLTGSHTYIIRYTYDIGKDPLKNADELYFNLIGDAWDTSISNVTFKITMPKEFDETLLGFSSGKTGSTNSSNVSYNVNGNVITGSVTTTLNSGEALTVRLSLPEGYFVGASSNFDIYPIAVIVLCLIFVLIADRLWAKYGKDDEVIETVEFYPPEGYNSAEVGFLYKGDSDDAGVISLLVYLANKGYIKIDETEKKVLFAKSKGFRITKVKEYDGEDENERIFLNGLFKNKDSVTASDLYDRFYITLGSIKRNLNSKENKQKIFDKNATGMKKWLVPMIIAIFILIIFKPVIEYSDFEEAMIALIFTGVGFSVLFGTLISKTNILVKIFAGIWGLGFAGSCTMSVVVPALEENSTYMTMYIIGLICIATLFFFMRIMPKRTPYGNEMLGKLRGFKRFLETAEKPQLEALVNENPEYFYNILPYTYALGVSEVWMKQFESIALQAPDWYGCDGPFIMHDFTIFMNSTMRSAQTAMSSSPSSDSGGSSGGGFSGGGSGGGGGGSW
jgi:uncharacterized membrane protein